MDLGGRVLFLAPTGTLMYSYVDPLPDSESIFMDTVHWGLRCTRGRLRLLGGTPCRTSLRFQPRRSDWMWPRASSNIAPQLHSAPTDGTPILTIKAARFNSPCSKRACSAQAMVRPRPCCAHPRGESQSSASVRRHPICSRPANCSVPLLCLLSASCLPLCSALSLARRPP